LSELVSSEIILSKFSIGVSFHSLFLRSRLSELHHVQIHSSLFLHIPEEEFHSFIRLAESLQHCPSFLGPWDLCCPCSPWLKEQDCSCLFLLTMS